MLVLTVAVQQLFSHTDISSQCNLIKSKGNGNPPNRNTHVQLTTMTTRDTDTSTPLTDQIQDVHQIHKHFS